MLLPKVAQFTKQKRRLIIWLTGEDSLDVICFNTDAKGVKYTNTFRFMKGKYPYSAN